LKAERLIRQVKTTASTDADIPECHLIGPTGELAPFHLGQQLAWDSERRIVAMVAGTQGGKTGYAPWWLHREIERCGSGDYLAVTANYDLFKLKLLPAIREVFETVLGVGRYWASDRIIELKESREVDFKANRADDPMWGRIILRSADASGGLESATAKAAILDEAGQDRFTLLAWRAIKRRLALSRGRILITTTLYNLGWIVQEVIEPAERDGVKSIQSIGNGELEYTDSEKADTALIQFDSIINPTYPEDEYEEARATLPDDEFELFYRGRVAQLRTLIYNAFDRRMHVRPRFPIPDQWKRYMGLDFGGVNTAAVFYAEEPGNGQLYCYREYLEGNKTAKEHAAALLEGEPGIPFCVGGSKSEGQWRLEFAMGGLSVVPPSVNDVDVGIGRVYAQHKQSGIIYFDDLSGVVDEKGRYRRKRDKNGNVINEIENKNSFHRLDAERYIIGYIRPTKIERAHDEHDRQSTLRQSSRWTAQTTPRWRRR
jgi:hypothetical protein